MFLKEVKFFYKKNKTKINKVLKIVGKEKFVDFFVYKSFYFIKDQCTWKFNLDSRKLFSFALYRVCVLFTFFSKVETKKAFNVVSF